MPPNTPQMPTMGAGGGQLPGYNIPGPVVPPPKKSLNVYLIVVIIVTIFLIAALIFGVWAYGQMKDYKTNTEAKVAVAVEKAKNETSTQKDKEFVEKEKSPHRNYKSPDTLASIQFEYPKTWSAFVTETANTNNQTPLDGYLHPDFVPGKDSGTDFALRVQVLSQPYSQVLNQYESKVKQGKVSITPYKAPKVQSVLGVRVTGEINKDQKDTMIILPLRDKTLQIWTESPQFVPDLDNVILATLTFVP